MKKTFVLTAFVLTMFVGQSIAEASSISTRVRVLEGKVAKQDRDIKKETAARLRQSQQVKASLSKMEDLHIKVNYLLKKQKEQDRKKKKLKPRPHYSYP